MNRAEATRSRGSDGARAPSERGTTSSRSSLVFHLCVSLLFYHSLLFTVFFFIQSKHHCCAIFQILFKVYFLLSVFLTFIPPAVWHVVVVLSLPSLSVFLSVLTSLHPPRSMSRIVSLILSLRLVFVILMRLTTCTEMVLEAQRTQGGSSSAVHVKAAAFPLSPRVTDFSFFFFPFCFAFCYPHSTAATASSSPASPLASAAHPAEDFSGRP